VVGEEVQAVTPTGKFNGSVLTATGREGTDPSELNVTFIT